MIDHGQRSYRYFRSFWLLEVLTYTFLNSTPNLVVDRQREIIREAFSAWADVTPLRFTEVAVNELPTFEIAGNADTTAMVLPSTTTVRLIEYAGPRFLSAPMRRHAGGVTAL